ncbi:hypothetical protein PY365_09500 [Roseiarcaceae bacterium H3SJ34-1]|uniref:hypothetical protein n=1 Tax=Terripilifer ovatus TaxID=3032367 RepID=UPI003AB981EB|nr:hypothetical protein [Roseiarcaceae bacterium H3SJ34-1]
MTPAAPCGHVKSVIPPISWPAQNVTRETGLQVIAWKDYYEVHQRFTAFGICHALETMTHEVVEATLSPLNRAVGA